VRATPLSPPPVFLAAEICLSSTLGPPAFAVLCPLADGEMGQPLPGVTPLTLEIREVYASA